VSNTGSVRFDTVLFELGTEELPPLSLEAFWESLWQAVHDKLYAAGLLEEERDVRDAERLFTARRLALFFSDVRSKTLPRTETRRGPAFKSAFDEQGQPTKALLGFASSCGAEKQQVERWRAGKDCLKTDKGTWVIFEKISPARRARDVLPEIVRQAVADVPLDVHMRWGIGEEEFTRPVRWAVLLYKDKVVPGSLMGLPFGQESYGHRALGSKVISIQKAKNYREELKKNHVLVRAGDRVQSMRQQWDHIVDQLQQECGEDVDTTLPASVIVDRALSSVENPHAVRGSFDSSFLSSPVNLPAEVVKTVLEDQQGFFSVRNTQARLLPYFVAIANVPSNASRDTVKRISAGYERVVRARLQDAAFYWRKDQQRKLGDRLLDMEKVIFHRKLGTLAGRVRRIEKLAVWVAKEIGTDHGAVKRAAQLCKADLGTDMVQSFSDLQGVMGEAYADLDGEDERVCRAIREHYLPLPEGGPVPSNRIGLALALADRLDMLYGAFAVDEAPTGARDPLGIRRAAHGGLILIWSRSDLDIRELIERAADGYPEFENAKVIIPAVMDYMTERLRGFAIRQKYSKDEVEAILAVGWHNPPEMFDRLNALHSFRQTPAGVVLAEANKRILNILRKTEAPAGKPDPQFLREAAEQALDKRISELRPGVQELCRKKEFQAYYEALEQLATLAEPVAKFFDDVLVMAEEPEIRHNRLRLLRDVRELFLTIADLSRLQGAAKAA